MTAWSPQSSNLRSLQTQKQDGEQCVELLDVSDDHAVDCLCGPLRNRRHDDVVEVYANLSRMLAPCPARAGAMALQSSQVISSLMETLLTSMPFMKDSCKGLKNLDGIKGQATLFLSMGLIPLNTMVDLPLSSLGTPRLLTWTMLPDKHKITIKCTV